MLDGPDLARGRSLPMSDLAERFLSLSPNLLISRRTRNDKQNKNNKKVKQDFLLFVSLLGFLLMLK